MSIEAFMKEMTAAVGTNDEIQGVKRWLGTGFKPLNKIIGGKNDAGFGHGRMYEIYGPSSSGKTAIATRLMIEAQKQGGCAIFIDYERSFEIGLAQNMGLSVEPQFWFYKQPDTWEQGNSQAAKMCELIRKHKVIPDDAPICVVQDSIAAAVPKSVAAKEIDEHTMNDTTALARVTSTTLKHMAGYAEKFNATILYLNQIRTKPGVVYGDPTTTPGGNSMEFYASGRLALSRVKVMDKDPVTGEKLMVAQIIKAKAMKSKHTRPFQETEIVFAFDENGSADFDIEASLVEHLIKHKVLEVSGGRIAWEGGKPYKKNLIDQLKADPAGISKLEALLPAEHVTAV